MPFQFPLSNFQIPISSLKCIGSASLIDWRCSLASRSSGEPGYGPPCRMRACVYVYTYVCLYSFFLFFFFSHMYMGTQYDGQSGEKTKQKQYKFRVMRDEI